MVDLRAGDHVLSSATSTTRVVVNEHVAPTSGAAKLLTITYAGALPPSRLSLSRRASSQRVRRTGGSLSVTPDHVLNLDGTHVPARRAVAGASLLNARGDALPIHRVSLGAGGIINPITADGRILAADKGAATPVVATVWGEWIADLLLSGSLVPLPISFGNALSYLFPATVQGAPAPAARVRPAAPPAPPRAPRRLPRRGDRARLPWHGPLAPLPPRVAARGHAHHAPSARLPLC